MIATVVELAELSSSRDSLCDYRLTFPKKGKSMYLDGRLETDPVYVHPDTKVEYK